MRDHAPDVNLGCFQKQGSTLFFDVKLFLAKLCRILLINYALREINRIITYNYNKTSDKIEYIYKNRIQSGWALNERFNAKNH